MGSRIVATGRAMPRTAVTNHDLSADVDTSDEWIRTRTGIGAALRDVAAASRWSISPPPPAAPRSSAPASSPPISTRSSSAPSPRSTAFPRSPASSSIASASIRFRPSTSPPPVPASSTRSAWPTTRCARAITRACWWSAPTRSRPWSIGTIARTAVLFGDGAGAAVLVSEPGPRGVLGSLLRSSGEYWDLLSVRATGVRAHARLRGPALARRRDQDERAGAVQDRGQDHGRRHAQGGRARRRAASTRSR